MPAPAPTLAITTITSIVPLFDNYHNVYKYRNLPLKNNDGDNSTLQIVQDFDTATPEMYRPPDVWVQPRTELIPPAGEGLLSSYVNQPVELINIFNADGSENVVGIISGNIIWKSTLPSNRKLKIIVNVPDLGDSDELTPNILLIPYNVNTLRYYVYLTDDSSVDKVQFTKEKSKKVTLNASIVDANDAVVQSIYFVDPLSDPTTWSYSEITGGTTLTSDEFPYRHIGILQAADITVNSTERTIIFDGTGTAFPYSRSTSVSVGSNKAMATYANQANWPIFNTPPAIIDGINTSYSISAWEVHDVHHLNNSVIVPNARNYLITDTPGDITCYPIYTKTSTPIGGEIPVNKTIIWSAENTTNKDQSGKFGTMSWTASKPTGIATVYITKAVVNSANVKLTKTGLNTTTLVQGYKGTNTVQNVTVTVPIVNGKITIYGTWYLQYGSANYLHPGYKNWHNGSGSITISKITY
jgi:hypothetical protein